MPNSDSQPPDYGHGDDWKFIDNVQLAVYEFGKDRPVAEDGLIREPVIDVACLECNVSQNVLQAVDVAMNGMQKMLILWANTMIQVQGDTETRFEPLIGDIVTVSGRKWLIVGTLETVFATQFRVLVKRLSKV